MSISMVSTVLEIERSAEDLLQKAKAESEKIEADAKAAYHDAMVASKKAIGEEIAKMESAAAVDKAAKVTELEAKGAKALAEIKNIQAASIDKGVKLIMERLNGK